jgi:hypothetical protein
MNNNKKPPKTDIASVEYLLGDLDPEDNETPEDAKARYLGQLNNGFEPTPTAIVDSGNGIQALWRLNPPIELGGYSLAKDAKGIWGPEAEKVIADIEARSKALMERLGAKAGTQNIDRILRLPGTKNLPNKVKREKGRRECPTRMLGVNGVSYGLDAFPVPQAEEKPKADDVRKDAHCEGEDKLERIIKDGLRNGEFKTRNHAVWWVINEMFRRGYVDTVILSTILDRNNKISAHIYNQGNAEAYAKRQIAEAKAKYHKTTDTRGNVRVEVLPASTYLGAQAAPIPPALIKGVLPQTGVAIIGGQSGTGKTFQAIHLGVRLLPDCKQDTYIDKYRIKRHGGVLYLVLEGKAAFPLRVTVATEPFFDKQMKFGDRSRLLFCWNSYEPNLFERGSDGLIKLAAREAHVMRRDFGVDLVAVMLDTMGLAACYENENMAAQVQKVITGLFRLSDETGALAIGIDHVGKDQGAGLRGSSAKRGHPETILSCLADRDKNNNPINLRMWFEKVRDGLKRSTKEQITRQMRHGTGR